MRTGNEEYKQRRKRSGKTTQLIAEMEEPQAMFTSQAQVSLFIALMVLQPGAHKTKKNKKI